MKEWKEWEKLVNEAMELIDTAMDDREMDDTTFNKIRDIYYQLDSIIEE